MAGFDGTGPMGCGPMTGGRRGYCNPAGADPARAFGYGRNRRFAGAGSGGRGLRRARVRLFAQDVALQPVEELEILQQQADGMKKSLDTILSRIAELEKSPDPPMADE